MLKRLSVSFALAVAMGAIGAAQQGGLNTPVLPGLPRDPAAPNAKLTSDLLQQRQVEPDIVVSTRNPLHLMAFFNDYRAVDLAADGALPGKQTNGGLKGVAGQVLAALRGKAGKPAIPSHAAAAEATVGLSRSYDGGMTWTGALLPGSIDDSSPASTSSPVYGLDAMTDPKTASAPCGIAYVAFIAFTRGGQSKVAVARYQDLNTGGNDTWFYQGTTVLQTGNNASNGPFHDLPSIIVDPLRTAKSTDPCAHNIYVGWATFTGTDGSSKLNFARATSGSGSPWKAGFTTSYVSTPDMTNQAVTIGVDPRPGAVKTGGGGTIYYGWRSFATATAPAHMWIAKSADYGTSFSKAVAVNGTSPLYTFDQPSFTTSMSQLAFRSNALPTLEVVPNAADTAVNIYMAWQERVNLECPDGPSCGLPSANGEPRIVLTRSSDGAIWTQRRAVDIGDREVPAPGFGYLPQARRDGGQVMPRLSFGGGRLALFYYETRGPMVGSPSFIADVDGLPPVVQQLDARLALLDPNTGLKIGTNQVSRYPIKYGQDVQQETLDDVLDTAPGVKAVNRRVNAPNSGSGTTPFIGDYIGITPIVRFVPDANGVWRWATKAADVPFQGFRTVFTDTRNQIPATNGNYTKYSPPGTNKLPGACENPGSRNHDVMHALVNASVAVNAATTFKQSTIQRAFPVILTNGTATQQFYRLTFDKPEFASWDQFDTSPAKDTLDVELFPYSSTTRVVYIPSGSATEIGAVKVLVNALMGCTVLENCAEANKTVGAFLGSVTLNLDSTNPSVTSGDTDETHNPLVSNPLVSNPLVSNPLVSNPLVSNPLVSNPLVSNPLVSNPLVSNSTVYDITDVTWTVQNGGNTNSAYLSQVAIANAAALQGSYAFQLLIYKKSMSAGLDGCNTTNVPYDQIISSIPNPLVSNPLVSNPLVSNPLVSNPLVSNATYNVAPPDGGPGGIGTQSATKLAAAKPGPGSTDDGTTHDTRLDEVFVTLRAYQRVPAPPVIFDPIANPPAIAVFSEAANVIGGQTPPPGTEPPVVIKISGTSLTVTNTNDSGPGSLRDAISAANAQQGRDTILFNIPGATAHTINLLSALPTITDPVILDATTQPGFAGTPVIELNGSGAGAANGVDIVAGNSIVRGLVINRFTQEGIRILTGGGNRIEGNYIGTDVAGVTDLGNTNSGIFIPWSDGNVVVGNLISGNNGFAGIAICGSATCGAMTRPVGSPAATDNVVQGNRIGTDASGSGALGNSQRGVSIDGASNTLVGGTIAAVSNVIAFNGLFDGVSTYPGVVVFNSGASGNQMVRNSIHSNGLLGIDLVPDPPGQVFGVTLNDGNDGPDVAPYDEDTGPNGLQNFPVLLSAVVSGAQTTVQGTLNTTISTNVVIEFFSSPVCDPSGNGEGQTYLGSVSGTTDGTGQLPFTAVLGAVTPGLLVTSTATTPEGTSEFSGCRMALAPGFLDWPVFAGGNGHVYEYVQSPGTWTAANAAAPGRSFRGVAGHLVTITSLGENEVVGSFRGATNDLRGWIGLTDSATEGTFVWVTGEPFGYSNWFPGEPNNQTGAEDFVEIFADKRWNDIADGAPVNQGYLVEYPTNPFALVDSPPVPGANTSGDFIDRGFYHPSYPGRVLSEATVWLRAPNAPGSYTISMTARAGSYGGPVLGTSTVTVGLSGTSVPVSFDFAPVAVPPNTLITFSMAQVSPGGLDVYYDVGTCDLQAPCVTPSPFKETEGTAAPLDTFRRNGVSAWLFDVRPPPIIIQ